jgi:hypothetical protein
VNEKLLFQNYVPAVSAEVAARRSYLAVFAVALKACGLKNTEI